MKAGQWSKLAIVAVLVAPALASGGLRDVGPTNASTGFPDWYRDTNATAIGLCLDQRPSPNASAGGAPMCFPVVADPAGYPGNLGGEIFFFNASASITGAAGFSLLWEGAIEATYATGVPIRGDEITFARIRVVMDVPKAGTYKVTHPYGVETFPNVQAGKRGVFFTIDIGVAPGVFTGALAGGVGPFLEWAADPLNTAAPYGIDPISNLPYTLDLTSADGSLTRFVGDPNIAHAVTGSPFGTNFVRVDGPVGSNLDGLGNDFIQTPLFAVLGTRWLRSIPTPLEVCRATYGVDGSTGVTQLDVFVESALGSNLLVAGDGLPTLALTIDPATSNAVGHAEFLPAPGFAPPATVVVTNLADVPPSRHPAPLTDVVASGAAIFAPDLTGAFAGRLSVIAETSIHTATAPMLSIVEVPDAIRSIPDPLQPWIQRFDFDVPFGGTPPWFTTFVSQAGGSHTEPVTLSPTSVLTKAVPPEVPFAPSLLAPTDPTVPATNPQTLTGVPVTFPLDDFNFLNAAITVVEVPQFGTVVVNGDGTVTYTSKPLFNGLDAFRYVLSAPDPVSGATLYSNEGTVQVTVGFQNVAPTANADVATVAAGATVTIDVAANDVDVDGTIDPASVLIATPPPVGSAVPNPDGTVTYLSPAGFVGTVTFAYTIADDFGARSAPANVTVTAFAQNEVLTVTSALHIITKARWKIAGTSTVFGPGLANQVSVYIGLPPNLRQLVGKATIDPTGAWTMDVIDSTLALDATRSVTAISTGGGVGTLVVTEKL